LNGGIPPILAVTPRTLIYQTYFRSMSLNVENGGSGSLSVDSYVSDASWLSVTPLSDVDENGFGTYWVTVTRDGLADGIYDASITFTAGTQQVLVPVIMRVGIRPSTSGGGYHYILLIDTDTFKTKQQSHSSGVNGSYPFSFTGLSYGDTYVIYAGTNPNNDLFICTEGETCGAYLSLDEPVILTVQDDVQNIEFNTDINVSIPDVAAGSFSKPGRAFQRNAVGDTRQRRITWTPNK
jgi:serine protease